MLNPIDKSNMVSKVNELQPVLNVVVGYVTSVRMQDRR